ncbi:MAG: DUF2017 domain-containing protein [Candidatus Nanopelagicaceae bacterium]|nr:DUF2017 domain-containing protein [Candidatus Nanopelagicaceae bacterium]
MDGDTFVVVFSPSEREVLVNLSGQLIEILAERVDVVDEDPLAEMVGITGHDSPPDDAVLLRLLPNAYADPVDSAEFRRYTESTLRGKKREHALQIRTQLLEEDDSNISLSEQGAQAWLGAINDIRLALGVRLNVEDNSYKRFELLSPEDPMQAVFAVYSWLGWLQESLVISLMVDE